jgi:hypothetical protein
MVAVVVKKHIEMLMSSDDANGHSGHSLRSGGITAAFDGGLSAHAIKLTSGHKSTVVLEGYDRTTDRSRSRAPGQAHGPVGARQLA